MKRLMILLFVILAVIHLGYGRTFESVPDNRESCLINGESGYCVPYYNCHGDHSDSTGTARMNGCTNYGDVCCTNQHFNKYCIYEKK